MSARRIVLRRAYRSAAVSKYQHLSNERAASRLGLPKLADRPTFQQWLKSVRP